MKNATSDVPFFIRVFCARSQLPLTKVSPNLSIRGRYRHLAGSLTGISNVYYQDKPINLNSCGLKYWLNPGENLQCLWRKLASLRLGLTLANYLKIYILYLVNTPRKQLVNLRCVCRNVKKCQEIFYRTFSGEGDK